MRIVSIVGARPQFVKLAPVSRAMANATPASGGPLEDIIVHTGQHYDAALSSVFFDELQIPKPTVNLDIGSGQHGEQTAKMITAIEQILLDRKPDMVVIYGDTNSTLAGALAAEGHRAAGDGAAAALAALPERADPLAALRGAFDLPGDTVYLDGNSLGALPRHVRPRLEKLITTEWGRDLISSWNRHRWIDLPQRVGDRIGPLIGAADGQVICADSISVNLFKLLAAALRLRPGRTVILTAEGDFPTDGYVAQGLAELLGATRCRLRAVPPDALADALDDDVVAAPESLEQHLASHAAEDEPVAVVGSLPFPPHVRMNAFLWYIERSGHYDLYKHPRKYSGGKPPMPPMT